MNTTIIGAVLLTTILGANGLLILDSSDTQIQEINKQFNDIMNGTMSFLDHSWSIAQEFQDPNYHYDASELINSTRDNSPSIPSGEIK